MTSFGDSWNDERMDVLPCQTSFIEHHHDNHFTYERWILHPRYQAQIHRLAFHHRWHIHLQIPIWMHMGLTWERQRRLRTPNIPITECCFYCRHVLSDSKYNKHVTTIVSLEGNPGLCALINILLSDYTSQSHLNVIPGLQIFSKSRAQLLQVLSITDWTYQ